MGSEAFLPHLKHGDVLLDTRIKPVKDASEVVGFQTGVFVLGEDNEVRYVGPVKGWHNAGSILDAANKTTEAPLQVRYLNQDFGTTCPIPVESRVMAVSSDIVEVYAIEALQKAVPAIRVYEKENPWRFVSRLG